MRTARFSNPPSEPDVHVSTHPALHEPTPLGYPAVPGVVLAQGEVSSTGFDGGFELPLSRLLGEGGSAVSGLVLDRWDEADLAVEPAIVEPVDVLGDGDLEVVDVLSWSAVADQFGLEQ